MRPTLFDQVDEEALERDGYVVLPLLDADEVASLRQSFDALGSAPDDPHLACHSSFHSGARDYKVQVDQAIRSVIAGPLAHRLDRQRPLPCNFIVKWPGGRSGFGLHQDLCVVDERFHRSVEAWIALEDVDERNGQLWMVPGSHTWLPTLRGINSFPFPFAGVTDRIIRRHAVPVPVRAGDCVLFNHAALHFSMPNRTSVPRMVAITDLIPEEAPHIHHFGDGQGNVDAYAVDDSFWTDNSPFSLHEPPPASLRIGPVHFSYRELTDQDLDRLLAEGRAIDSEAAPRGAINAGRAWCHRCGTTEVDADAPSRTIGNVTLLCDACADAEATVVSASR